MGCSQLENGSVPAGRSSPTVTPLLPTLLVLSGRRGSGWLKVGGTLMADRSAGRWCATCKQYGSHHTDKHEEFVPSTFPELPPQDVLDVLRDHTLHHGIRDGKMHCICGWINHIQSHNEHVAEMLYEAGFVHKNQISDMIYKAVHDKKNKRDDAFYEGLIHALSLVEGAK